MNTQSKTYYSSVYKGFLDIEEGDHRAKVRYAERNMSILSNLDQLEYFGVLFVYHSALFELGQHRKQIEVADRILEMSIEHHIDRYQHTDVFIETLYKKAAALYNLDELEQSTYVVKELLKINPTHEPAKLFLINCLVKERKNEVLPFRGISIAAILASAVVIGFELLYVRPFAESYVAYAEMTRNSLFIVGVLSLIFGEVWMRYKAVEEALELIRYYKERKQNKE